MNLDEKFSISDLFADEEARFEGVRQILTRSGASVATVDLVSAVDADGELTLETLSRLSLVLGLEPRMERGTIAELALRSTLFAFEDREGVLWLFMPGPDGMLSCLDVEGAEPAVHPDTEGPGRAIVFADVAGPAGSRTVTGPVRTILQWMHKPLLAIVAITFASNLLGLSVPLFTLAVYDQVLASGNVRALTILVMGLGIGLVADMGLRIVRSHLVSLGGAHLDIRLSSLIMGTMLRTADRARLAPAQIPARLRDADRVRQFLLGTVGISLVEAPFVLIYVAILVLLLGWAAMVPVGILAAGFVAVAVMLDTVSRQSRAALARADEYGSLGTEIAERLGSIRAECSEDIYAARFRDASARLGEVELLQKKTAQTVQLASGILVSLTVLMTLSVGAHLAMDDALSVGALIASIALVWRMSAPLPVLLQARLRWPDVSESLSAIGEVLGASARDASLGGSGSGTMAGRLTLSSVNFTYERGQTAAIRNLSFDVAPGELIAITGPSGAGKSTLLDLLCGLRAPQFGSIMIDGVNPQQIAPSTLLQSISYLSREAEAVPLPIHEFLRLGVDPADRCEIDNICDRLRLTEDIAALPDGDRTLMSALHAGSGLGRGLALARVIATGPSMILLDEPDTASRSARAALLDELARLRGQTTVLVVTHSPSVIEIADRVMVLHGGALARFCTPREIVRKKQA